MTYAIVIWISMYGWALSNDRPVDYTQERIVYGIPDDCKLTGDCTPRRYNANNIFIDPDIK